MKVFMSCNEISKYLGLHINSYMTSKVSLNTPTSKRCRKVLNAFRGKKEKFWSKSHPTILLETYGNKMK